MFFVCFFKHLTPLINTNYILIGQISKQGKPVVIGQDFREN